MILPRHGVDGAPYHKDLQQDLKYQGLNQRWKLGVEHQNLLICRVDADQDREKLVQ